MISKLLTAALTMGMATSALATSSLTCTTDEAVQGQQYSFNFIVSDTAGSALVQAQIKTKDSMGRETSEILDRSNVAQYWADGFEFKAKLIDDQALMVRYSIQTKAGPVPEGGGDIPYEGFVTINKDSEVYRRNVSCF